MTTTANTSKRLSDKAKPWIIKAIKTHGQGDSLTWELGVTVVPDPSATGELNSTSTDPSAEFGLIPALVVFLELPTDDTNISIYSSPIIPPYNLTESKINKVIKQALEDLRTVRDRGPVSELEEGPAFHLLNLDPL